MGRIAPVVCSFALLSSWGCKRPDLGALGHLEVVAAELHDIHLNSFGVIGGVVEGDAALVYTLPDGRTDWMSVALSGPQLGLVFDVTGDPEGHARPVYLDLTDAPSPTRLEHLVGTYRGTHGSLALGLGVGGHSLRNKHGVSFQETHFQLGAGIQGAFEWLKMRPGGDDVPDFVDPTEPRPTDTGPAGPTADTAIVWTAPTQLDTGYRPPPSPSGGCGCGAAPADTGRVDTGRDGTDTDTEPPSTPPEPTEPQPTTPPPPDDDPPSSSSSSCSDGSCGDGCSTAPTSLPALLLAFTLCGVRRRAGQPHTRR
jgi:hypothetical protein